MQIYIFLNVISFTFIFCVTCKSVRVCEHWAFFFVVYINCRWAKGEWIQRRETKRESDREEEKYKCVRSIWSHSLTNWNAFEFVICEWANYAFYLCAHVHCTVHILQCKRKDSNNNAKELKILYAFTKSKRITREWNAIGWNIKLNSLCDNTVKRLFFVLLNVRVTGLCDCVNKDEQNLQQEWKEKNWMNALRVRREWVDQALLCSKFVHTHTHTTVRPTKNRKTNE